MIDSIATGKINTGISRMVAKYPLHAGILANWQLDAAPNMPTMAVGIDAGTQKLRLLFSPRFVESISMAQIEGLLHHEANHVLFDHVLHRPEPGEDPAAMMVAMEVSVNEYVPEQLPGKPIVLADYPFLKPHTDTGTRYRKLLGRVRPEHQQMVKDMMDSVSDAMETVGGVAGNKSKPSDKKDDSCKQPPETDDTSEQSQGKGTNSNKNEDESSRGTDGDPTNTQGESKISKNAEQRKGDRNASNTDTQPNNEKDGKAKNGDNRHDNDSQKDTQPSANSGAAQDADNGEGMDPQPGSSSGTNVGKLNAPPTDSHDTWAEIQDNSELAQQIIESDISMAWGAMTEEQRKQAQETCADVCPEEGNAIGTTAGNSDSSLTGGTGKKPWQRLLQKYVGKELDRRPVFGRLPRRFPELIGILPGKGRMNSKPKVVAAIDTSGSMSHEDLADISKELLKMSNHFEVTVVECDTEICDVYPFRPITNVSGRGGTDLRPPLEPAFLKKQRADLVVYFTDGMGPAPEKKPKVPVIWCLTAGGAAPASWGRTIMMHDSKEGEDIRSRHLIGSLTLGSTRAGRGALPLGSKGAGRLSLTTLRAI